MRKLIYFTVVCSILLMGFNIVMAKEVVHGPVPEKVMEKFNAMYPNVKEPVSWSEMGGKHKADFVLNNKSISLIFKKEGELVDSKIEIEESELPAKVLAAVKKEYLDMDYKTVYIMKKLVLTVESYEIEVMKGRLVYVVRYDKEGNTTNKFTLRRWDSMSNPSSEGGF